jgi:hypothetical protein
MTTLAFTGTREGMTPEQINAVRSLVSELKGLTRAYHGDCVGADAQFANLILQRLATPIEVFACPSNFPGMTPHAYHTHRREPSDPLERNRHMVECAGVLIAAPKESVEQLRGGTWYTVRYGRRMKRQVYIVLPDGSVTGNPSQPHSR